MRCESEDRNETVPLRRQIELTRGVIILITRPFLIGSHLAASRIRKRETSRGDALTRNNPVLDVCVWKSFIVPWRIKLQHLFKFLLHDENGMSYRIGLRNSLSTKGT